MGLKKIITNILIFVSIFVLIYSYYYLPSKNKGYIELSNIEKKEEILKETINSNEARTTFFNTEYKIQNDKGQVYTTKTEESYINQKQPDLIHLINPYSFTKINKDQSSLEIFSKIGLFDKIKKITTFQKEVVIKNKNYLITADSAQHFSEKNIIIISGNVIMKDLTSKLSHIIYCDTLEINTHTNDAIAFMNTKKNKVLAKKFK